MEGLYSLPHDSSDERAKSPALRIRLRMSLRPAGAAKEREVALRHAHYVAMHGGDGEAFAGLSAEIEAHRKRVEGRT